MTRSKLPLEFNGSDLASQRYSAVQSLVRHARRLLPDLRQPTQAQLQEAGVVLQGLATQWDLFPAAQFAEGQDAVYRLYEDKESGLALFLSAASAAESPSGSALGGVTHTRLPDGSHVVDATAGGRSLRLRVLGQGRPSTQPAQHARITPQGLKAALADREEIAVLDVRESGVFTHCHILFATSLPLWRIELLIDRMVPRRNTRIVLVDADETLVHEAAAKLHRLGWGNVSVLAGGTQAWAAEGYEVFTGSNVLSKAFGEVIEVQKHTPHITADDLEQRVARGDDIVVVDSRTPEEFTDFSLPFAHSLPGAELVYRIQELAPNPETLVVVNCAGRTRSILGAQTLIDAGIPNRVVSLQDGTMAWLLSGRSLAKGRLPTLPQPGAPALEAARARAEQVAQRAGVCRIDSAGLAALEDVVQEHSLYRFDVRTREEYLAGHLEGWRWAPGGQLVQATDEYLATRNARVVLADWDGVRALTTGAWLAQLGGLEIYVYSPEPHVSLVTGAEPLRVQRLHAMQPTVPATQAAELLRQGALAFDVERRAPYERKHIAGARFAVPDRLEEFVQAEPATRVVLLTSSDGVLALQVAAELAHRTGRDVRAIAGGTKAWVDAGLPTATGGEGVLTGDDDSWFSPYHHSDLQKRDAGFRAYLDWELGLVAQIEREGDTGIRLFPAVQAA